MRIFLLVLSMLLCATPVWAAIDAFVGNVTAPNSTGDQAETGVGFTPELVIFFGNPRESDGTDGHADMMFSGCISTTVEGMLATLDQDAIGASDNANQTDNDNCIIISTRTIIPIAAADMKSLDADGFTLDWTSVHASLNPIINYIAFDGLDNAKVGTFLAPTSTGNSASTDPGFQPDAMFTWTGECTSTSTDVLSADIEAFIGMATGTSNRGYVAWTSNDANATANVDSRSSASSGIGCETEGGASSISYEADFVSFDANGFTYDWTTVLGSAAKRVYYIAMEGGSWTVDTFTQKTSTGSQSESGLSFDPVGVLFLSDNETTFGHSTDYEVSLGAATSSTEESNIWWGANFGSDPMEMDRLLDSDGVINMVDAGTPSTVATADYTSNDTGGFTINWSVADSNARNIIYMAFGNVAAAVVGDTIIQGATLQGATIN